MDNITKQRIEKLHPKVRNEVTDIIKPVSYTHLDVYKRQLLRYQPKLSAITSYEKIRSSF